MIDAHGALTYICVTRYTKLRDANETAAFATCHATSKGRKIMSKTILITGTSNGFGNDIAQTLAAAGHRVFATMRDINGRHREAAKELQSKGIETLELDVTDNASVDSAFKALFRKTGGKLDV